MLKDEEVINQATSDIVILNFKCFVYGTNNS